MSLYACNLGAGGIDYRCPPHLAEALRDPDNQEAGIRREDYVPVDPDDPHARCEACVEEHAEFIEALERFRQAAHGVLNAWPTDDTLPCNGYPEDLPSFDDFVLQVESWFEAQTLGPEKEEA